MNNLNPSRMTQEQVQDLVRPLLMSTGTFSSWLKSTAVTARHHSMNSPRLYRLERKKIISSGTGFICFYLYFSSPAHMQLWHFLLVYRKCSHLAKSSWSTICSKERPPPSHLEAVAATSQPSPPASTAPSLCWAAATRPPTSAMAVPQLSRVTVSRCSAHWPLTRHSGRSWSSRGSSGSFLNITCDVVQQP